MADISGLSGLQATEQINQEQYKDASSGFQLPKAGVYTLRAPESIPDTAFSPSKAGALQAQIDPTIVGPTDEGFTVRFTKVSAKVFDRAGAKVSYLGDYLRATGWTGPIPGEPKDQANAVEQTAGRIYQAELDWEARHNPTGFSVKGMRNFPSDGNGGYQNWVQHPTEKDAEGNPLRLRANIVVKRYIPA